MLKSVLIANRGEIARRVIRTARRLGVRTVAVYSEADADAPHVREADAAVLIGPPPARESYLVQEKILAAARETGAEAIHPGYGFLSENAEFAEAVVAAGLVWVGAPPHSIRAMGLKDAAKKLMSEAGVPVTPGYLGEDQSPERLQREADAIGYPVLIKAVAGGGGKGMRKVEAAGDFLAALASCQREAAASFGDDRVLLEKYVTRPRHIEVQVFGDTHGNVVHLFERDCSLQRRHQKVIEEAPAPGMDAATRAAICQAAVNAAKAVDYVGAGTIEFIADASAGLSADRIWFMEMNTRLQVEHPVTEAITGLDLVEWQLRVASGEPLPLTQDEIAMTGHAMEARLYAENPATGFLPSIGPLEHFELPDDLRVDSAVERGGEVSPYYDPMIAKLIAHRPDRKSAASALAKGCGEIEVWPVRTNAGFLARLVGDEAFRAGEVHTGFIEQRLESLVDVKIGESDKLAAVAVAAEESHLGPHATQGDYDTPWLPDADRPTYGFRLNATRRALHAVRLNGEAVVGEAVTALSGDRTWLVGDPSEAKRVGVPGYEVHVEGGGEFRYARVGDELVLFRQGEPFALEPLSFESSAAGSAGDGSIRSPMPGKVSSVAVKAGDTVAKGQTLMVLEAMKMEHALAAPFDGEVAEVSVAAGDQVSEGVALAKVTAAE